MHSCLVLFSSSRVGFLQCELSGKKNVLSVFVHVVKQLCHGRIKNEQHPAEALV